MMEGKDLSELKILEVSTHDHCFGVCDKVVHHGKSTSWSKTSLLVTREERTKVLFSLPMTERPSTKAHVISISLGPNNVTIETNP